MDVMVVMDVMGKIRIFPLQFLLKFFLLKFCFRSGH